MRHQLAVAFMIACTVCSTRLAYSADETRAATFRLDRVTSPDAATALRTIAGVKNLQIPDDHTVTVRDTPETIELATAIVKMLDAADEEVDTTPLPAKDGSVIAAVVLDRASSGEVMVALRKELRIARFATVGEKRILLRDTDSQVQEALKVIARLERSHS